MREINKTTLVEDIDFESASVDAEKMNYKEKLNKCIRRVYGCNYSEKPKYTKRLKKTIDRGYIDDRNVTEPKFDMNEDVDSLIQIVVNHYWLPPYMTDRTKLIMYNMWSNPDIFHDIKYENVVLGILMYVVYQDLSEAPAVDFMGFCTKLFGIAKAKKNIGQMYRANKITCGG